MKWKQPLKKLQRPVDLIVGENDELFIVHAYATLLTPLTPHISVQVLPGLGHVDIYVKPVAMNAIVESVKRAA